MRHRHYKLVHRVAVPCSLMEWGRTFENIDVRRVGATEIEGFEVSTVFLGLDHHYGDGPPLIFETMIFGEHVFEPMLGRVIRESLDFQVRYSTWEEAERGHEQACAYVREQTENAQRVVASFLSKQRERDE